MKEKRSTGRLRQTVVDQIMVDLQRWFQLTFNRRPSVPIGRLTGLVVWPEHREIDRGVAALFETFARSRQTAVEVGIWPASSHLAQ